MKGKGKKILLTGLTVALLNTPFLMNDGMVWAKEQPKHTHPEKVKNELTTQQAIKLASDFAKASAYVQRGGDYKAGEYKTFSYKGKTYRYLASSIDTKKELVNYLAKTLTRKAAEQFLKDNGIIEYKGKMAQVEADGGSLLQWEKATAKYIKSTKNTEYYQLTVPVGDTGVTETYMAEYQYVQKVGWRLSNEPSFEQSSLTAEGVLDLAKKFAQASSYVQAGGSYRPGEYQTFTYGGKTYRYLSSSIDTRNELLNYLKHSLTHTAAEQFIKSRGIIEYNGRLAQIEADGGSLLQWDKATAKLVKSEDSKQIYQLIVPVGNTTEKQTFIVELQFVKEVGWRISKEPALETNNALTDSLAVELATKFAQASSYVQAGGTYRPGEYQTFTYQGKTYRYLSSSIDTKSELLAFLKNSLTQAAAESFIQSRGIIEYNGRLAQVEADGGSLLRWDKATAQLTKNENNTLTYLLTIPVGDTTEKQNYLVEYQYVQNIGWRISKEPYWNLDIPGNINPAFNFVTLLLKNTETTKQLFINPNDFNVEEFKKGIKKIEYVNFTEIGRKNSQVEYIVKVKFELESSYKGTLENGENNLYFLIQPVGYMDFKIAEIGRVELY
ncbi:DL-endopeptidase inhibitor IseA family protein [Neobacillus sp. D3-1R]|uniref:DL-endopeptidase inhibitor IseA family protein n=1 Tax=Neobacillus sp. D3-1R TaxID=3445778 RepID=UPI003FA14D0E